MTPIRLVWTATAAFAVIFFVLGLDRYVTFHAGADLGIFTQAIANAANGMHDTYENGSHFAFHFSPILYLCAPFVWLAQSPLALTAIQSVAVALVAPALFLIARRRTGDVNAALLACVALLYPPLHGVAFTDFHEVCFVPAAVAWLLWAIDARRFGIAAALVAVSLCIKEDQAPAMAFLGLTGLVYFAQRRERTAVLFCAGTIVASIAVFLGYFLVLQPLASARAWAPQHFYDWTKNTTPIPFGQQLIGRATYLLEAFVPLAFLPLRSRVMLLAIPGFAEVLFSADPLAYTMGQHYAAVWIPYVLVAFVTAGADLFGCRPRAAIAWTRTAAALCILVSIFFSPLHLGHFLRMPNEADAATNATIALVPRDASVGAYDEIYAHLGLNPNAAVGVRADPQYVIYDTRYRSAFWNGTIFPQVRAALDAGRYAVAATNDGVTLLRLQAR